MKDICTAFVNDIMNGRKNGLKIMFEYYNLPLKLVITHFKSLGRSKVSGKKINFVSRQNIKLPANSPYFSLVKVE